MRSRPGSPSRGARCVVARVALVAGGGRTAFIVQVHNPGGRPVSDLPISVGVLVPNKAPLYLNLRSQLEYSYFDSHLPLVTAGGTLTWVYTTDRHLPAHAKPFALVGGQASPAVPRPAGCR